MTERAPNWVTAPLTKYPCPHVRDGIVCGNNILGRIRFPPSWVVYTRAIAAEKEATGQGPVKQCRDCKGWVEVVIRARPT
jgi:hypothetical protein